VERLSDQAGRRLVALIDTLLRHPVPRIRVQVLARCGSLALAGTRQALLPRLLSAIASPIPDERTAAAASAMSLATADDAVLIAEGIGRLLDDRRALTAALGALQPVAIWRRAEMLPVLRAVLDALARDPLTAGARARLAVQSLPWEELGHWLEGLAATGLLHADALVEARGALRALRYRPDIGGLTTLERTLAVAGDDRLRRFGLAALVAIADAGQGWDADRLARLHAYRADRSPLVAEAAQFTLPSEEVDPRGVSP
jgi:hypothetical protein